MRCKTRPPSAPLPEAAAVLAEVGNPSVRTSAGMYARADDRIRPLHCVALNAFRSAVRNVRFPAKRDPKQAARMKTRLRLCLIIALGTAASALVNEPLLARGGAASIMNSPGYQRRLQESRQQLPQSGAAVVVRKKSHQHRH